MHDRTRVTRPEGTAQVACTHMAFDVATPVYEGPFDLLLHLILREQVDIYEVPLARIVDAYLDEELALWEERDLLLARLLECKTFKDVAQVFSRFADAADRSFPRES